MPRFFVTHSNQIKEIEVSLALEKQNVEALRNIYLGEIDGTSGSRRVGISSILDFGHPWVSHYKKRQNRIKFICME